MELDAVEQSRVVADCGKRAVLGGRQAPKVLRERRDAVTVAHPHINQAMAFSVGSILDIAEQGRVAACAHLRIAKLAFVACLNFAA